MAALTDTELLNRIKVALGITGDYMNETLQVYIDDVKAFMESAGVPDTVVNDSVSVGCIRCGVADLWNYGNGNAQFSEYFRMRLVQLTTEHGSGGGEFSGSYNDLEDKPSLNGTTIQGDLESDDVGIDIVTNTDVIGLF